MKKLLLMMTLLMWVTFIAGCGTKPTQVIENGEVVVEETASDNEEFEITMEKLFKERGKATCTMTTYQEGMEMNAVLYMDGKKMRTNTKWNVWGIAVAMNTLTKDGYTYTRNENEKSGWKELDEDDYDDDEYVDEYEDEYDGDEDMDNVKLKCKKWISNKGVFDLPKDITFNEMPEFDF